MLLTHMWYWCMVTRAWQTAVSEERASSTAQLPPPSLLSSHSHSFFSVDVNIFWPSHFSRISVYLNHSPLALFLPFTASHIHISFSSRRWPSCSETGQPRTVQWHWGAKLPQMHVCVTHSAQQRPHGIYIPHGQSHSDPRDSLIINSNLNLTSNADPRDNIVVMISTQKNPLQVLKLSCFLFAFHAPEFSTTPCLHNRCSSSLQNFLGFSLKRRQIFLQLLMKHNKQLKEF